MSAAPEPEASSPSIFLEATSVPSHDPTSNPDPDSNGRGNRGAALFGYNERGDRGARKAHRMEPLQVLRHYPHTIQLIFRIFRLISCSLAWRRRTDTCCFTGHVQARYMVLKGGKINAKEFYRAIDNGMRRWEAFGALPSPPPGPPEDEYEPAPSQFVPGRL